MKQGVSCHLHVMHLESGLSQVLAQPCTEAWTTETFLERALRKQQMLVRRLTSARIPAKKIRDRFDCSFQLSLSERRASEPL